MMRLAACDEFWTNFQIVFCSVKFISRSNVSSRTTAAIFRASTFPITLRFIVIRRQLKRRSVLAFFQKLPPCLVGIEACASAHHWSRELQALGHNVRLIPPAYVKPYGAPRRRVLPVEEGSTQRVVD